MQLFSYVFPDILIPPMGIGYLSVKKRWYKKETA